MKKIVILLTMLLMVTFSFGQAADLFFSEYIEGGGDNKAVEIFNGTGAAVDLGNYIIRLNYNGNPYNGVFELPAVSLADGDVFVIAHADADSMITSVADTLVMNPYSGGTSYMTVFNGDDVRALCKVSGTDTSVIDIIGRYDLTDPGSGWDVAGVAAGTKDHTIVRKSAIGSGYTDWDLMAGTNADNSEWLVFNKDSLTFIGSHTMDATIATSVDVTFRVNSSTVQGLTDSLSHVDLRGTATQWGPGTDLVSDGGDYWSLTITLDAATGFDYKYGARTTNLDETVSEWWENDIPGSNYQGPNRSFATRYFDQVLDLDYLGHGPDNNTPNYTATDSVDIFFRVNMGNFGDFDPDTHMPSVVGHGPLAEWFPGNFPLTREGTSDYWNVHLKLSQAMMDTIDMVNNDPDNWTSGEHNGLFFYRFCYDGLGHDYWGNTENLGGAYFDGNENRTITFAPSTSDTTIAWVWWNDDAPQPFSSTDSTDITFTANMSKANDNNSFTVGDTLLVKVGYGNSSVEVVTDTLVRQGFTFSYATTIEKLPVIFGEPLYYQYYLYKYGLEQREVFFNFDYDESDVSLNERRFIEVTTSTTAVNDFENSETDARRMPIFRNNDVLAQTELTLTLECDIRPAIYQVLAGTTLSDVQTSVDITPAMMTTNPDTILDLGVYVNGPLSNNAEGTWQTWGGTLAADTTRKMYDDGTHGDAFAGDSIFTIIYVLSSDSGHTVGQEFKFGIGGGDNESGYGLNHIENLDDSGTETTLFTQFGSINPNFYDAWDFDAYLAVDQISEVPSAFSLRQNYPNPFNPTTTIEFSIPEMSDVSFIIYNTLGQKVISIERTAQSAGTYNIVWNGTNDMGVAISTGVYFYQIKAGDFTATKKMIFMK